MGDGDINNATSVGGKEIQAPQTSTTTAAVTSSTTSNATTTNTSSSNGTTTSLSSSNNGNSVAYVETIKTFENLLRKSQRLVIGLRDLPQFGRQWQPFFQKTFEIYTKLWKFQQQYRSILEDKSKYGLKRCEIGEIASKIGQLYYHYYLRTSDTNYLNESFIFYEAIRLRAYFKEVNESKVPDMMVKQLRYYARFIVVCLLLNRKKVVFELVEELFKHVNDYAKIYKPQETQEWSLVLQEIFSFLQADQSITFIDSQTGSPMTISHRLNLNTFPMPPANQDSVSILQQCILVGNHHNQIKFSEITLDMFRITQALEYEINEIRSESDNKQQPQSQTQQQSQPQSQTQQQPQTNTVSTSTSATSNNNKKKNPNKYLLYRPTVSQLLVFLANASKELSDNKAILLYLSVDGIANYDEQTNNNNNNNNNIYNTFYSKGLVMNSQKPIISASSNSTAATNTTTYHFNNFTESTQLLNNNNNNQTTRIDALYPIDLLPFCRKPFFLIIDSQSSLIFKDLPIFNQPFVSLLSPISTPKKISMNNKSGNLFTFFLHDSLSAFCDITSANKMSSKTYSSATAIIQTTMQSLSKLLFESKDLIHPSYSYFLMDDFLRSLILRFIFCHASFYLHKEFQESIYQVTSSPEIPVSILNHPILLNSINSLSVCLGVQEQFIDISNLKK
ncbi:UPF0682 family protein [Tieghemostelium lacteum]|uniref:UPF0682 family protein n=1 Tax=Tieghemostelium lacteum TaxID=361077 RepID=A0A152A492_TIELA|nr:UPF0682 family protein [Tieghemostelium lacteum]|eukprot:KYR01044.1 UPF0682 family protein [Tieghemostelium lacteum]